MDDQTIQQLTQLFQQGIQILQNAGGGGGGAPEQKEGGGDEAMPMNKMDDSDSDEDQDQGMNPNAMQGGDDEDDDEMGDDQSQGMGGASLHDRVSQLENHTGLKKAAAGGSISDRLDALEQYWFGQEFEGEDGIPQVQVVQARVRQLEKAVGVPTKSTKPKTPVKTPAKQSAPEVIPLDSLIKTAIAEAIAQTKQSNQEAVTDDLPSPSQMRKEARQFGKSRRSSHAVSSDEDLNKAANAWGMEDDELDKPLGLGDALLLQYHAARNGYSLNISDDGDSD